MIQRSWQKRNYGRGQVKTAAVSLNRWECVCGNINPNKVLVDDRSRGGFSHYENLKSCQACTQDRSICEVRGNHR